MLKTKIKYMLIITLLAVCVVQSFGQTVVPATKQQVDKLVGVLKSNAPIKDKMDACRLLSIVGTKEAIAPLASLLGDEKLSHMARYGLEPIPAAAVDDAFRKALGRLKGRSLVGVIGSIGVRRDVKAINPLKKMLARDDLDSQVTQAIARTLGKIGNAEASEILQTALSHTSDENRLAVCEGLFRCAEALLSRGRRDDAIAVYDKLLESDSAHQVRAGALRGAILARGTAGNIPRRPGETTQIYIRRMNNGLSLLQQHLRSNDYILFSAAVQTAQELPGTGVTRVLTTGLDKLAADNQILVIQTLGKRGDAAACPALFALAGRGAKSVRIAAMRSLSEIGDASAVPVLVELLNDGDIDISQAAQESFAALPGRRADKAVMEMLNSSQRSQRLTSLELIGRRRMTGSISALLKASADDDAQIRPAALRKVAELGSIDELPALLDLLMSFKNAQDLAAAERALSVVCMGADNPESYTNQLTDLFKKAKPDQKSALLRVLSVIGGTNALKAVRAEVDSSNSDVRAAAIRALCAWKTADAAPDLLALAESLQDSSLKTASLRGYINLVRDEGLTTEKKLQMCRQATALIERNEEKKLLLGVLGTVPASEALSMAMTHLDDPETRNEASFAAVAISEKIVRQKPDEVANAMRKVMRATKNRNVTRRARTVLDKAK